ncbi:AraC family transcriptional regulator [Nocardia stercoris]|nr:AraC family transcriptional regulator [Nocardia stercoris]
MRGSQQHAQIRSIASATLLAEFAQTRGLKLPDILRNTDIHADQLTDHSAEISLRQELAVMRNIVSATGDEPGLGLMAGLLCHPPSLGVLGFAIASSSTLRRALEISLRYSDLLFVVGRHWLEEHGDELWIVRDDRGVPPEVRRFAMERDLAALATIQQDLLPTRLPLSRVQVVLPAHPIYEMFGALFGVDRIDFGARPTILAAPAAMMDMPLPQSNPTTARFYEQQCAEIVQRRRGRVGISGRVRQLLIRHGGVTDQTHIAADLDLSVRTLRRRLADEGTTFRELSTETIGLLAEELLTAGLTVEQVADRLGYSSVSAFATAFRSWKGQPPGHFARTHRGRSTAKV